MEEIRSIVMREKSHSVSDREWKHRLVGYGYKLEETASGFVVSSMRGEALLTL
ncbi:hypothetical protein KUV47_15980 [Vannielia litorea]|uniref:hypothetical protein n=1 Tax=Vannielia TaxID=2813041 RepID=UPI001C940B20|nr:hypothetical protein [Vannielia litorea]MBY6049070.1 hypothetical protein [Vannielia litorea]MBY6076484.1 hypothetical protein [Vannielia litorea]MBY6154721.1 hypothetical protein [Vannielia litorea]